MQHKRVLIDNYYYTLTALSTGRVLSLLDVIEDIQNGISMDYESVVVQIITESLKKVHYDLKDGFIKNHFKDEALINLFNDLLELSGLKPHGEDKNDEPVEWSEIYAHLSACTGWTPKQIDEETTLNDIVALNKYYESHPPVHTMVAAYLGIKPKEKEKSLQDFIGDFLSAGGKIDGVPTQN
jgi:capsule polysaccharide modification protein KpsS